MEDEDENTKSMDDDNPSREAAEYVSPGRKSGESREKK